MALLRSKDERAFHYVYDRYGAALYGVVFKVVCRQDVASDLLQEVFVKIWKYIDQYDESKGRLYTWMLRVARNTAIDALRSKNFKQEHQTVAFEHSVYMDDERHSTQRNLDVIGLRKSVMGLKKEWRELVDMAYFQGFTQEEIAQKLDIPLGTVKTRLRSALSELKSIFR